MDSAALSALIAEFCAVPLAPKPVNETWKEMIARIRSGRFAEIDRETYWYFLEVLPPHYLGHGYFAFVEGAAALRLFFARDGEYHALQLTWDQTVRFCQTAGIRTPSC